MDTVGSIIDKLCILEKRIQVQTDVDKNNQYDKNLIHQRYYLISELGRIIVDIVNGRRPACFKKHKLYDSSIHSGRNGGFLQLIDQLNTHNKELWSLEDIRRDKTLSDKERLQAADDVSVHNKFRNDIIDAIDQTFQNAIDVNNEIMAVPPVSQLLKD